ncbi:MAG: hypothetical protein HY964_05900 [Ignavibacteriales bacterium]|nr:hypothetical protein [Ignavibacteriales bacterium]
MLFSKPTKYGAGIILYGDYWDLKNLHTTIHELAELDLIEDKLSDFVLYLAYDIRHAYQRHREILDSTHYKDEKVLYYGVKILWPIFLVQLGLLRRLAAYHPTSKSHQADIFRLEACAEEALKSYDPITGKWCIDWYTSFGGFPTQYNFDFIYSCSQEYVTRGKSGKDRFKLLPDILRMISFGSKDYSSFTENLKSMVGQKGIKLNDSIDFEEWPKFKW